MNGKSAIALSALGVVIIGALTWALLQPRDPLFHGKPESEWITNILYSIGPTDAQLRAQEQQWRDFGPEGLQVLERALAKPPSGRKYNKFYGKLTRVLPSGVMRLLPDPQPRIKGGPRHLVLSLLSRMGTNGWPIWTAVAPLLADEDDFIQGAGVNYFTAREDENTLLNHLPRKEKHKLLPLFIHILENTNVSWGVRNNAAIALRYYPEEGAAAAPALTKALQDPSPFVRLQAAQALGRVNPEGAQKAGAAAVLIKLMSQNAEYSPRAAFALRSCQSEADLAVPALIEAIQGTNDNVACDAIWSLEWAFRKRADLIIPAMKKTAERKDYVGRYAKSALVHLETGKP